MGDAPRFMSLEAAHDLPAGADDPNIPIAASEEEAVGAGAYRGNIVALEEGSGIVVGELDVGHIEEVKRLPLFLAQC